MSTVINNGCVAAVAAAGDEDAEAGAGAGAGAGDDVVTPFGCQEATMPKYLKLNHKSDQIESKHPHVHVIDLGAQLSLNNNSNNNNRANHMNDNDDNDNNDSAAGSHQTVLEMFELNEVNVEPVLTQRDESQASYMSDCVSIKTWHNRHGFKLLVNVINTITNVIHTYWIPMSTIAYSHMRDDLNKAKCAESIKRGFPLRCQNCRAINAACDCCIEKCKDAYKQDEDTEEINKSVDKLQLEQGLQAEYSDANVTIQVISRTVLAEEGDMIHISNAHATVENGMDPQNGVSYRLAYPPWSTRHTQPLPLQRRYCKTTRALCLPWARRKNENQLELWEVRVKFPENSMFRVASVLICSKDKTLKMNPTGFSGAHIEESLSVALPPATAAITPAAAAAAPARTNSAAAAAAAAAAVVPVSTASRNRMLGKRTRQQSDSSSFDECSDVDGENESLIGPQQVHSSINSNQSSASVNKRIRRTMNEHETCEMEDSSTQGDENSQPRVVAAVQINASNSASVQAPPSHNGNLGYGPRPVESAGIGVPAAAAAAAAGTSSSADSYQIPDFSPVPLHLSDDGISPFNTAGMLYSQEIHTDNEPAMTPTVYGDMEHSGLF